MYKLSQSLKDLKFDKRMIDLNFKRNVLTAEEYKRHLKSLEDVSYLKEEKKPQPTEEETEGA